ncbi:hypothetical protein F5876DRAFT_72973 [Lentinula aff. lateritia]|uniref:Uncharacterized protein n=1 Tax=Lentinula aff. lateritia TaxID=2804960 RepID=A0ACC1UBH9_9AGAR|nr:hypothetical protein F5876DRAFT_72973 [Lentinula aff. lateritia]
MDAIAPILNAHQAGTLSRLEDFEQTIRGVLEPLEKNVKNVEQSQASIQKTIFESSNALQETLVAQTKSLKNIISRVHVLELVIGKGDETSSIADKVDSINYSMGEFLERALDPYAPIEPRQKHDVGISPVRETSLTPSEPTFSRSSIDSSPVHATRKDKTLESKCNGSPYQQVRHERGVSPIKTANPTRVYHDNATSPITIPACLRRPNTSDTRDTDMNMYTEVSSQSSQSSIISFPLTAVDWTPGNPNPVAAAQVDFFRPDLSPEGRRGYSSLSSWDGAHPDESPAEIPSPRGPHVPSSRIPPRDAPFPTPPNDNPPSAPAVSSTMKDNFRDRDTALLAESSPTATRTATLHTGGSPSPSVIDEAFVLRMVNSPGSSIHDTKSSKYMALDIDQETNEGRVPPSAVSSQHTFNKTSLPTVSALFSATLDDELSDLTSISDSNSDGAGGEVNDTERPRKRPRLSRQASVASRFQVKQEKPSPSNRGRQVKVPTSVGPRRANVPKIKQKPGRKRKSMAVVVWPNRLLNEAGSCGTVIQCDICQRWYHCGCVGFAAEDPTLDNLDVFKCPLCISGSANFYIDQVMNPSAVNEQEKCSRPDCTEKAEENIFFVERIIGRRIKAEGSFGRKRLWLVKWLNYPVYRATWEEDDSIGGNQRLIENFVEDLRAEGIEDDLTSILLLQEASNGGWNADEPEVVPLLT